MRLQAECEERGVLGVVVVRFAFDARVLAVLDRGVEAALQRDVLDALGEFEHAEGLGELIEHLQAARVGRVRDRELDARHGVAQVDEAARLSARAVDAQRMTDEGFDAKTIENESVRSRPTFTQRGAAADRASTGR